MKVGAMQRAIRPLLKLFGLPSDFTDRVEKTEIASTSIDLDEDLLSAYITIRVKDSDSLQNVKYLAEAMIAKLEELKGEVD